MSQNYAGDDDDEDEEMADDEDMDDDDADGDECVECTLEMHDRLLILD